MIMRNFGKAIEDGERILKNHIKIDISNSEIAYLMTKFDPKHIPGSLFEIITEAYTAGVAVGMRNKK